MSAASIAILSYHGWEIDPARLADDVTTLRNDGWRDLSLDELWRVPSTGPSAARYFHVTLDDGSERDADCIAALRSVACGCTLFLSLDTMPARARSVCASLSGADVAIGDHTLRHARVFTTRHVIGFWTAAAPLVTAPERLGLEEGDPICTYGGELTTRAFTPDPRVVDLCRTTALATDVPAGSAAWRELLAARLVDRGLAFYRMRRLCVAGAYETRAAFVARLESYLADGRQRLLDLTGVVPTTFAHPWWEPSRTADRCLQALGYTATFSGRGMWRGGSRVAIPRVFVSNETPRPLDAHQAASVTRTAVPRVKAAVARAVFS